MISLSMWVDNFVENVTYFLNNMKSIIIKIHNNKKIIVPIKITNSHATYKFGYKIQNLLT